MESREAFVRRQTYRSLGHAGSNIPQIKGQIAVVTEKEEARDEEEERMPESEPPQLQPQGKGK